MKAPIVSGDGDMILISAGHHSYRKGASYRGFYEYDEASIWASIISNLLGREAMCVPSGLLASKVSFINSTPNAIVAVEVHFNSAKDSEGNRVGKGSETLYYPGSRKGKEYAKIVQSSLSEIFPPDRGAKEGWYQMDKSKGPDYFLSRTKCPALIVEPEFIHRKETIIQRREEGCKAVVSALSYILKNEAT